jgi:hypothetical protein
MLASEGATSRTWSADASTLALGWPTFAIRNIAIVLHSNISSSHISGMDDDVDFSGWDLPPLEDDPDQDPPPERESWGGVSIGSDLVGLEFARGEALDLGDYVCNDLVAVRPSVVGLADLGSTDFAALSQKERVDALLVIE